MRDKIKAEMLAGIEMHTGRDVSMSQIKVVADPQVSGTWAARVDGFYEDGGHIDLLFVLGDEPATAESFDEALEEVEYTSWPPKSGPPSLDLENWSMSF